MKRLLLPALLLLSSPAWADVMMPDEDRLPPPVEEPKPSVAPSPVQPNPVQPSPSPETQFEPKGRSGCMAATSLTVALAALMASWLTRGKRQTA
jgi:hypothetical protein